MLPPTPSLCRIPPTSSPFFFPYSFSSAIAGNRRLNLQGGCWRHMWPSRNVAVICMANQRRVKMVAKQIRRELSDMLLTDKVIKYAVLPEASLGADRYLSSLTTISDVVVSGDLQVVKVYVSVFGDERGKEVAIAGLKAKTKYVRSELGKRMKLRLTPEIRFIPDDSIERGSRVIAILDKLKDERENSERKDEEEESKSSGLSELDEDWGNDDPDEEKRNEKIIVD